MPRKPYKPKYQPSKQADNTPLDFDEDDEPVVDGPDEPDADEPYDEPVDPAPARPARPSARTGRGSSRASSRGSKRAEREDPRGESSGRRAGNRDARDSRRSPRGRNNTTNDADNGGRGRRGGRKEKDYSQLLIGGGIALALIIIVIIAVKNAGQQAPVVNDDKAAATEALNKQINDELTAMKTAIALLQQELSGIERREAKSDEDIRQRNLDELKQAQAIKSRYEQLSDWVKAKISSLNSDDVAVLDLHNQLTAENESIQRAIAQGATRIEAIEKELSRPTGAQAAALEKAAEKEKAESERLAKERLEYVQQTRSNIEVGLRRAQDKVETETIDPFFNEPDPGPTTASPAARESARWGVKLTQDGKWDSHYATLPKENPPAVFIHGVGNIGKNIYVLISFTNTWTNSVRVMNIVGDIKQIGGSMLKDQSSPQAWFFDGNFKPSLDEIYDTEGKSLMDEIKMIHPGETVRFVFGKHCEIDAEAAKAGRASVSFILFQPDAPKFYAEGPMQ